MSNKKITKAALTKMAKELGVKRISALKKADLIHQIQLAEGNSPCFDKIDNCAVTPCLFRKDCQG